ncbi:hypothetical protein CTI12_AA021930 [Artemisia annua]|uniref:Uncharacterized protein n=1 Tax=Artemisia annua TaxID=35608 RepID=A0A2U1QIU7_ARTAN|nr:hypothetical protein CTI12_AA021930 [Artemisia annua]
MVNMKVISRMAVAYWHLTRVNSKRPFHNRIAIAVLLAAALVMEPDVVDVTISLALKHRFMWLVLVISSTMAYAANWTNFLATKNTSALTLQI